MRFTLVVPAFIVCGALASDAAQVDHAAQPALVMGADGLGLVAYYDTLDRDLKVAHCADADCTTVTTVTVDSAGDVGGRAAIAIRPGGLPVVAYEDATNDTIKLALCNDAACATAATVTIGPVVPSFSTVGHVGLAIGADGRPLVAYAAGLLTTEGLSGSQLRVVHCDNAACTVTTSGNIPNADSEVSVAIAGDGRPVIVVWVRYANGSATYFLHCVDLACTSTNLADPAARAGQATRQPLLVYQDHPSLAVGPDGLPVYTYSVPFTYPFGIRTLRRCSSHDCATSAASLITDGGLLPTSMAIDAAGRPHLGTTFGDEVGTLDCNDAGCTNPQRQCVAPWGSLPSIALDAMGQSLVATQVGTRVDVRRPGTCQPTFQGGDDVTVNEGNPPTPMNMSFTVRLHPPAATDVTVAYEAIGGTAQAGSDYVPTSGVLTFAAGEVAKQVVVQTIPDLVYELDETFELVLTSTSPVVRDRILGRIGNDDALPMPAVSVRDCTVVEGNTGTTPCVLDVRLGFSSLATVTLNYLTTGGTATPAVDYVAQTGTLTFAPGSVAQTIPVAVLGDVTGEPDEYFNVALTNLVNALPGDMNATGSLLDDDWPVLPGLELSHGSTLTADFEPDPGPVADRDDYRIVQAPYASYEVVMDALSGDATPGARLERVAADGVTALDEGEPVGTGSAVALRFMNTVGLPVASQYLRVSNASCGTACGPDDTYRLRVYETTGRIPRFNNSGSQTTVLILQNTTDRPILVEASFWSNEGERLATQSLLIGARGTSVTNTGTIARLETGSGSVTVQHSAPYGALAGKAVSLEPSTGFSFDSPMVVRPR